MTEPLQRIVFRGCGTPPFHSRWTMAARHSSSTLPLRSRQHDDLFPAISTGGDDKWSFLLARVSNDCMTATLRTRNGSTPPKGRPYTGSSISSQTRACQRSAGDVTSLLSLSPRLFPDCRRRRWLCLAPKQPMSSLIRAVMYTK